MPLSRGNFKIAHKREHEWFGDKSGNPGLFRGALNRVPNYRNMILSLLQHEPFMHAYSTALHGSFLIQRACEIVFHFLHGENWNHRRWHRLSVRCSEQAQP